MANKNHLNRRDILKGFGLSAVGLTFGGKFFPPALSKAAPGSPWVKKNGIFSTPEPAKVALIKGNDCREIVYQALKKIEDEILTSIGDKKKILIKPNFVVTSRQLAATHVDAVRGILDFLKIHFKHQIIIGESTISKQGTFDGFKNYGYLPLEKEYKVKLVDLNHES